MKSRKAPVQFDKYFYYRAAVQSPDADVEFLRDTYRELRGRTPRILREDFCGTFSICCEWVKLHSQNQAIGLDLDPEPVEYGRHHYLPRLTQNQRSRLQLHLMNVMDPKAPHADVICAMNFSYFIFKTRAQMRLYFQNTLASLKKDGVFILDVFGGSACHEANEDETKHRGFTYYWEQMNFDPVTHYAEYQIHFKLKGQSKKIKNVFSYDWRMWTIPELRELLEDVGFRKTHVYWEGTTRSGSGDGAFHRSETGEECDSWIAYIAAEK